MPSALRRRRKLTSGIPLSARTSRPSTTLPAIGRSSAAGPSFHATRRHSRTRERWRGTSRTFTLVPSISTAAVMENAKTSTAPIFESVRVKGQSHIFAHAGIESVARTESTPSTITRSTSRGVESAGEEGRRRDQDDGGGGGNN